MLAQCCVVCSVFLYICTINRWNDITRRMIMWVEIMELNDQGQYMPVPLREQVDVRTGGIYQLKQVREGRGGEGERRGGGEGEGRGREEGHWRRLERMKLVGWRCLPALHPTYTVRSEGTGWLQYLSEGVHKVYSHPTPSSPSGTITPCPHPPRDAGWRKSLAV